MPKALPFVSVLLPCRNERPFIRDCLDSILTSDYPPDQFEVLVMDGMSDDGTRETVQEVARACPRVRLLDNVRRITPAGLNLGIGAARGDLIAWMSAHNVYREDYLRRCVEAMEAYGADNAGGGIVTVARGSGPWATAVVAVLTHPFGVGNSEFRTSAGQGEPRWADTVFGGCYRREVFDKIGLFNERLVRGQDMEFNLRMRRAGCRTLFVPAITSDYMARTSPLELVRHTFTNGAWAILPFAYSNGMPVSVRHLVPLGFALALLGGLTLATFTRVGVWALGVILAAHLGATIFLSVRVAARGVDPRAAIFMPPAFLLLHLSYGLGSVWGTMRLLFKPAFWRKLRSAALTLRRIERSG
jgi:succinoglycan biosynthesis protein ExoA